MNKSDRSFFESVSEPTFEQFMASMETNIDWLQEQAKAHNLQPLNFDINELDEFERLFIDVIKGLDRHDIVPLALLFSKYLGKTVRRTYGGKWMLCEEEGPLYHMPVITGHTPVERQYFSPFVAMIIQSHIKHRGSLKLTVMLNVGMDMN